TVAVGIERKYSEESLRATQERLQHVLASSPAVVYSLRLEGEGIAAIWVSENVRTLFGHPPDGWSERFWLDNVHPADRAAAAAQMPELLAQGHLVSEYRFRHRDGGYRWVRDEKRLVRAADGRPVECVGSWADITDRKRAEEALQESENRLRQLTENTS